MLDHLASNSGGRNYDYTKNYDPEKEGEEAKENARVWNVYLDEAGDYDADMIEGFRNIIDGLLVFAALFSAVVTTFVAQTSEALQPDNAQIMVSLLVENNQLLRAAGNRTSINAVPTSSIGPESRTHTSIDVWVNGLFFTSLALSLSTALLSVLAKQWIQAYITIVPGDAKTRALTRQFRFEGLEKWKLGDIIESLPLILHCSVAVFLVGLALYVSQLSKPICSVVVLITVLTFFFYFASSMIPALDIACPYRIPFMFRLVQFLGFAFQMLLFWCCDPFMPYLEDEWPAVSRKPLKMAEKDKVLNKHRLPKLAQNSLCWVYNHSLNHSVKEIVIEGTCGLLNNWKHHSLSIRPFNDFFLSAITYSLSRLEDMSSTSCIKEESTVYARLIEAFIKTFSATDLRFSPVTDWKTYAVFEAYELALRTNKHMLSRRLLDWADPKYLRSGHEWSSEVLMDCARLGDAEDFRDLVDRGVDLNYQDIDGWTVLHRAAFSGNVDGVISLVELVPALISVQGEWLGSLPWTPLDLVAHSPYPERKFDMVACLLEHGAKPLSYHAVGFGRDDDPDRILRIQLLLDCGWDRTVEDNEGKTLLDVARSEGNTTIIDYLEHYQTVRIPYKKTFHIVDKEAS